jgi:hypothetical protein
MSLEESGNLPGPGVIGREIESGEGSDAGMRSRIKNGAVRGNCHTDADRFLAAGRFFSLSLPRIYL